MVRAVSHTASESCGGDCPRGGCAGRGRSPAFPSTSSAVLGLLMTASTRRLPPHGHAQTSASKVLRCRLAQSSRRRRCGPSRSFTQPAPLPGLGAGTTHAFSTTLTTLPRSFAFGANTPWNLVRCTPFWWDECHKPLHQALRREHQHLPLPRPVFVPPVLAPRQSLQRHRSPTPVPTQPLQPLPVMPVHPRVRVQAEAFQHRHTSAPSLVPCLLPRAVSGAAPPSIHRASSPSSAQLSPTSAKSFTNPFTTRRRMRSTSSVAGGGTPHPRSPFRPKSFRHQHVQVRRQLQTVS